MQAEAHCFLKDKEFLATMSFGGGPYGNGPYQNQPPFTNGGYQTMQPPPTGVPLYGGMPMMPMPSVHPGMMPLGGAQTAYPTGQGPLVDRPVERDANGFLKAPEVEGPDEHGTYGLFSWSLRRFNCAIATRSSNRWKSRSIAVY